VTRLSGRSFIAFAAMTWGTTGATMKLVALDSPMSPLLVGFFRVAIAAPCLIVAARALGGPIRLTVPRDRLRLLVAGLAMGGYQACYFWGVAKTSVAVGALIAICSAPLMITVLAAVVLREQVTATTWVALVTGVTGAALLTVGPRGLGNLPAGFLVGVLLAVGAGLSYAVYAVLVKDVVARVPPFTITALTFSIAAASLAPALLTEGIAAGPTAWALLLYLGVVPTALAYILYVLGLRTTPVTVSGILTLMEPLTATMLGVVFFGDRLGLTGGIGTTLLVGAVALLTLRRPGGRARASPARRT